MKALINKQKTTSALVGYYDENGSYHEMTYEKLELKDLDRSITRNVYLDHDITVHVAPSVEVRVFAKNLKDIEKCLEIKEDPEYFKAIFDAFSKYNRSVNGEYIYTTFELEELIKEKTLPTYEF